MSTLFLSIVASALSVGATVPQILKILRKSSTADLSLACFSMHTIAGVFWAFYGLAIAAPVLAIEAALVAVLNLIVCIHILEQWHHTTPVRRSLSIPASLHSIADS